MSKDTKIRHFALGYKAGFSQNMEPLALESRKYLWSFAGDPNKPTRRQMLEAMRSIGAGWEHLTSGFNSNDALDVASCREIMRQSIFVPCPIGNVNANTFRVYEALEAGCIPIVERQPEFDYFAEAYYKCPILSVEYWSEATELIEKLQKGNLIEKTLTECKAWWNYYKSSLKMSIRSAICNSDGI